MKRHGVNRNNFKRSRHACLAKRIFANSGHPGLYSQPTFPHSDMSSTFLPDDTQVHAVKNAGYSGEVKGRGGEVFLGGQGQGQRCRFLLLQGT